MVKKLIAGILGKKEEESPAQSPAAPGSDVPDELPPLAEDLAAKTEEEKPKEQVAAASVSAPAASKESAPDELPPLDTTPSAPASLEEGTLADLEPASPIPDAIKKAKLAKLKAPEPPAASAPSVKTETQRAAEDAPARERIKSGNETGFFTTVLDHIKRNDAAKDKLLTGDLFVRMDSYWEMRKHEIKSGKQIPNEKKLEDDMILKLEELKILEQKWQVQKLALEEDLKYLHEREREIQAKIKELKLINNELNLYRNIKPEEYFYMRNGVVLKNLHDLIDVLEIIDDDSYNFHVKPGKNDFSDWVLHVFKDNNLAQELKGAKSKIEMIEVLETIPIGVELDREKTTHSALNPRKYLWLANGVVIRSLYELSDALKTMEDELFEKHVNAAKNDFAKWVTDVLKNEALGIKMSKTRSRGELITLIEAYI